MSAMTKGTVVELVKETLLPMWEQERARLDDIDRWYRWEHEPVQLPPAATRELRALRELSRTPWLHLVVSTVAQTMSVDGYRSPETDDDMPPWRLWQRNDLGGRQAAIHRASLAYGVSYATALPGQDPMTGERMAVLRGVSPRKMLAVYADTAEDDWPVYALRVDDSAGQRRIRLYDDDRVYYLGVERGGLTYIEDRQHAVGVCPVVRYCNMLDLDGRSSGEVEPFIDLARRIDKTTYDRLLIQHFSSWKVRTVAGMAQPDDQEEANRAKLLLRQNDVLVSEDPDTRFGTLDETPLDGIINAADADIRSLAAASQTPTHAMTGDLINLSVEALTAANAQLEAKRDERRTSAGKSHDQLLRLGSHIDGDDSSASDYLAHVTWADTTLRSLAAAADALGKIATMLQVPVEALWDRIPGVTKTDVAGWKNLVEKGGGVEQLLRDLAMAQTSPAPA